MSWFSSALHGVTDTLFGKAPKLKQGSMPTWMSGQRTLFGDLAKQIKTEIPWGGISYPGRINAGPNPLETTSLAGLEELAKAYYQPGGAGSVASDTYQRMLSGDTGDWQDYYRTNIQEPMVKDFSRDILPAISRAYAPSGFYSSQRLESENRAREDLLDALTKARSATGYQAWENAQNRALTAMGMEPPGVTAGRGFYQVGAGARMESQADMARQYQEWIRQRDEQYKKANLILAALGLKPIENYSVVQPGTTGLLPSLISAGGKLGSAAILAG